MKQTTIAITYIGMLLIMFHVEASSYETLYYKGGVGKGMSSWKKESSYDSSSSYDNHADYYHGTGMSSKGRGIHYSKETSSYSDGGDGYGKGYSITKGTEVYGSKPTPKPSKSSEHQLWFSAIHLLLLPLVSRKLFSLFLRFAAPKPTPVPTPEPMYKWTPEKPSAKPSPKKPSMWWIPRRLMLYPWKRQLILLL